MKGVHWTIICFCILKMPQLPAWLFQLGPQTACGQAQYGAKPSEYWERQLRNWPKPLVEPTSYDRSMAEAYISELHPAALATSQAVASAAVPPATKPAVASAAAAPQPPPRPEYIMPFDIGSNIVVLRERDAYEIHGLRYVPVKLFTCRWDGTPGYSGQLTLSIPRDWLAGKLPLIMVLPGTDDRRLCAGGENSKAQAAFKSAVVIECNAAVRKKGPAWAYHPQPWMAEMALYMKSACATHLVGIGYSRGTSWLIQLAAQRPGIFDKIVLLAPYPPPDMDDAICGQRIASSFANLQNILVVGSDTDECECTEKVHPQFWQLLARGMPSWIKMEVGHGQFERGVWRLQKKQWAKVQSIVFSFMLAPVA